MSPRTQELFREDAYRRACQAKVLAITDRGGVVLDQTVFYPTGGGQPGDSGWLMREDGTEIPIATTVTDKETGDIVHVPEAPEGLPAPGETLTARLDWPRRYSHMRVHTALHLLSAVLPYGVTGGQIGAGKGRLDFDIPEAGLDKDAVTEALNALIAQDLPVTSRWITEAELDAQPDLVKTMSVKPPRGSGRVRLIEIAGHDLQPCGGTHVRRTGEIGPVTVTKIEKKGARNRRVRIALAS